MLRGKLRLHDIADVEAFCSDIIKRSGLDLNWSDREELLTFLIETAWELSLRFDAELSPTRGFSTWGGNTLKQRLNDWQRRDGRRTRWQFADRIYERTLPSFVPLEHRPDIPEQASTLDTGRDSDTPLAWVVRERDRERVRQHHTVGEAAARRAA